LLIFKDNNYYDLNTEYDRVESLDYINFVVIAAEDQDLVINSVGALGDTPIYVLKDSILEYFELPVIVICCFGTQSIGKSTFLNELTVQNFYQITYLNHLFFH